MRNFKGNLTRLIAEMRDRLPDEGDLYGYPGVTRGLLLDTCNQISLLASEIEAQDDSPKIEIITLKRMGSKLLSQLHKFITEEAQGKGAVERFDDFLDKLSRLYEKTKQVYFIVNLNGLHTDLELARIHEKIEKSMDALKEIEDTRIKIQEKAEATSELEANIEESLGTSSSQINQLLADSEANAVGIKEQAKAAKEWHALLNEVYGNVKAWDVDIEGYRNAIKANLEKINQQENKIAGQTKSLSELIQKAEVLQDKIDTLRERSKTLLNESETTLAGSNRAGMAASFADMKNEMEIAQRHWETVFFAGLGSLIGISLILVLIQAFGHLPFSVSGVFLRIATLVPPVWLTWFAAKKHGIINRVREDYAYKYSAARAYEGFRKAAIETNEDLAKDLIQIAILHLGLNPIRLYEEGHKPDLVIPGEEFL